MVLSLLHLVANGDDQHCSNNGAYGPRNDCSDDGSLIRAARDARVTGGCRRRARELRIRWARNDCDWFSGLLAGVCVCGTAGAAAASRLRVSTRRLPPPRGGPPPSFLRPLEIVVALCRALCAPVLL